LEIVDFNDCIEDGAYGIGVSLGEDHIGEGLQRIEKPSEVGGVTDGMIMGEDKKRGFEEIHH